MNERIKELLHQAQELAREEVKNTPKFAKYAPSYTVPGTQIHVGLRLSYEKFAELIVRECAKVILAKAADYPDTDEWHDWTNGMDQAQADIVVHFGVEE